jgi:hypothetical protein
LYGSPAGRELRFTPVPPPGHITVTIIDIKELSIKKRCKYIKIL